MVSSNYTLADSPRTGNSGDITRYNRLVQDTTSAIRSFHQTTRGIVQKTLVLGTAQDTRTNHEDLKELTDRGTALVNKVNKYLQELYTLCRSKSDFHARIRKTEVNKLSTDFKNQCRIFEDASRTLVDTEKAAIARIRQRSSSFQRDDSLDGSRQHTSATEFVLSNYNEDQAYAEASVTTYNEDDLAWRERDLIHIDRQVREVNTAFREVDDLVNKQGELVVTIESNADKAHAYVEDALNNVRQADKNKRYCACSRTKLICYGFLLFIVSILVLTIVIVIVDKNGKKEQ